MSKPRQIAFYGKGGIGKSTVVANLASAMVEERLSVLQIGCDPKHDSSRPFWDGARPRTVVDLLHGAEGRSLSADKFVMHSPSGVHFVEVGGPEPGVGCAGRGILKMFEVADESRLLESGYDVVIYDVLGDVVCGGFAAPLRAGYADLVYVVLSGEFMAVYAANNICRSIAKYAERRPVRLGGLVLNRREVPGEIEVARAFAERIGSRVVSIIPRDPVVAHAERNRRTVVEAFGDSPQAQVYRQLARQVVSSDGACVPTPLGDQDLEELYYRVADDSEIG